MKISVICPVFNTHPGLLVQAARSVLDNGASHQIELILVDDCSTNPFTIAQLKELAADDRRVRVISQPTNGGPARARAAALARASHDWIGFIDSDDLWPSGKLDMAEATLRERPDARWISGDYATLGLNGELRPSRHFLEAATANASASTRCEAPESTRSLIGGWLPLGVSIVQKQLLVEAGGFEPTLIYGEDWLLFVRLSVLSPMDYYKATSYVLRRQGASMMRSPDVMSYKLVKSGLVAWRDPLLRPFRRELRWWCYRTFKDIAMNNALNGRKWQGALYAMRALLIDPREIGELAFYLRSVFKGGPTLAADLRRYSRAEQVVLSQIAKDERRLAANMSIADRTL